MHGKFQSTLYHNHVLMIFRYLFSRLTLTVALQRISISWADVTGVVSSWTQDQEISSSNFESRSKRDTAKLLGKCTPLYNASSSLTGSLAMSHEPLHPAGPPETKLSQVHIHTLPCHPSYLSSFLIPVYAAVQIDSRK